MSKEIDLTKPLSAEDRDYLVQRGKGYLIDRNDLEFASQGSEGPSLGADASAAEQLAAEAEAAAKLAAEQNGASSNGDENVGDGDDLEPYENLTVDKLKDEIRARNAQLGPDDEPLSLDGKKADLIATLEADDDQS